jgi:hypothetical protein
MIALFAMAIGLACLVLIPKKVSASPKRLSAGAARADITPDPAMINWVDQKSYDGVLDPLHVRALCLNDEQTQALLICVDMIDITEEALVLIRRAVHESTEVPESHIPGRAPLSPELRYPLSEPNGSVPYSKTRSFRNGWTFCPALVPM